MPRNLQRRAISLIVATACGLLLLLQGTALAVQSVTFTWAPNPEPNIAGYRIHYGVASRAYTQVVDTGNTTEATIENLVDGTTYYFALGAYNTLGLESGLTGELV